MDAESLHSVAANGDAVTTDGDPSAENLAYIANTNSSSSGSTKEFHTVLSMKGPFLQLNGRSSIEVDETGIFISIPTLNTQTSTQGGSIANPALSPSRGSQASKTVVKKSAAVKRATRRGLRIPVCVGIKVSCVQPLSLVMTLPITRKALLVPDSAPTSPVPPKVDEMDDRSSENGLVKEDTATEMTAHDSDDAVSVTNDSQDEPAPNGILLSYLRTFPRVTLYDSVCFRGRREDSYAALLVFFDSRDPMDLRRMPSLS